MDGRATTDAGAAPSTFGPPALGPATLPGAMGVGRGQWARRPARPATRWRGELGAQRREEDHLADRVDAGQQHHQPVDPDPQPARRRHPVLERADVVVVDVARLRVAALLGARLGLEARRAARPGRSARSRRCTARTRRRSARSARRRPGRRGAPGPAATPRAGSRCRTPGRRRRAAPSRRRPPSSAGPRPSCSRRGCAGGRGPPGPARSACPGASSRRSSRRSCRRTGRAARAS